MSQNTSDPGRIERDLDQTRVRLDTHLAELQERLSPGQVVDDLLSYFRGTGGDDFTRNLVESVRANPLPAAVTGIGLAWLMASNPRRQAGSSGSGGLTAMPPASGSRVRVSGDPGASSGYDLLTTRVRGAEEGVVRRPDEAEHAYQDRLNEARGQAMGLARQAQETAESFAQRVQAALASAASAASQAGASMTQAVTQGAHDLRDRAGDVLGQASGAAQQVGQQAGNRVSKGSQAAQRLGGNLVSALTDSPVLLGVIGLAAGALLGALVPQSDQEEAALGDLAGRARGAARDLAQDALDRGGHVVETVLQAGRQSAGEHGLAGATSLDGIVEAAKSGDLAGNAAQVARDVIQAADQAVRREGLGGDQGSTGPAPGA